ncbi:hypothetical protein SAMN04490243_0090 [Robiginitalea myxolifaciens]|uniref:Uncharacterized protein n=1 Tax=Robiginitalea myxolifaciens TaxID=400055 RepID=A0A1I6FMT4_9FLAO|nr:hypothetical protein [Robiginitalea myxolifaciens]SFR31263.1 hypothetical protein SAMN04490243_0090 [Robiginitalea myxolifaciens]
MRILAFKHEYQPEAIAAAQEEIADRTLSEDEKSQIQQQLQKEQADKERRAASELARQARWSGIGTRLSGAINPISEGSSSLRKRIVILCIFFGLHSLFIWYTGVQYLQYVFDSPLGSSVIFFLETLLLMLLIPLGVFLFWIGKRAGWILLMGYTLYYILSALIGFIVILRMRPVESGLLSTSSFYDRLVDVPSAGMVFVLFAAFLGIAWTLDNSRLKAAYKVTSKSYIWAVTLMLLILVVSFYSFSYY